MGEIHTLKLKLNTIGNKSIIELPSLLKAKSKHEVLICPITSIVTPVPMSRSKKQTSEKEVGGGVGGAGRVGPTAGSKRPGGWQQRTCC